MSYCYECGADRDGDGLCPFCDYCDECGEELEYQERMHSKRTCKECLSLPLNGRADDDL